MKRSNEFNYDDELNIFIQETKELFGYDEATLLAEMEAAERDWEREQLENPEEAARIMQENDSKFEELMRKLETEGIRPASERYRAEESAEMEEEDEYKTLGEDELSEVDANNTGNVEMHPVAAACTVKPANEQLDEQLESAEIRELRPENSAKKVVGWRKRKKVLLMVAAVAVLGLGTTMMVQGNRGYKLKQYPVQASKNVVIHQNSVFKEIRVSKAEEAYNKIEEVLEMDVIVLNYLLPEMKFEQLFIENNHAVIKFKYNDQNIYLKEMKSWSSKELSGVVTSDRKECGKVYNAWLDKMITMEENVLENGLIEYSAGIEIDECFYYLSGIVKKDEFVCLIEGLSKK